jgi:2-C-methyl-D-erythritol 4-phosphate cytidylyltransferase
MGGPRPKQYLEIQGRPLVVLALEPFERSDGVDRVVLVVPPSDVSYGRDEVVRRFGLSKVTSVVPGGPRRQDSVRVGLEALGGDCELVLIHDAVRPLIDVPFIKRIIAETREHRAVVPGLPVRETLKEVNRSDQVLRTLHREAIRAIQTPQGFFYKDILEAHRRALAEGWDEATDDAALLERAGIRVRVIEGAETNIKVTRPNDLDLVRFYLGRGRERGM